MKTYTLFLTLAFLLFSCSSTENKAKKAIKENLKLTLHDYKSYEPVQFGKLEVAMSSYIDEPEVVVYLTKAEAYMELYEEYSDKADLYDYDTSGRDYRVAYAMYRDYFDSTSKYLDKIKSFELHYVPKNIGWQMTHSFRAKTLGGNFGLDQYLFIFNKELTRVVDVVDLSEE